MTEEIARFVNNQEMFPYKVQLLYFKELIKNSYDAYAIRGLKENESLIIEVVLKQNKRGTYLKIKDNGTGFINHEKGETFTRSQVGFQSKGYEIGFTGGQQVGLKVFENNLKGYGEIYFKNRKDIGGTVIMFFKKPQQSHSSSSNDTKFKHNKPNCSIV